MNFTLRFNINNGGGLAYLPINNTCSATHNDDSCTESPQSTATTLVYTDTNGILHYTSHLLARSEQPPIIYYNLPTCMGELSPVSVPKNHNNTTTITTSAVTDGDAFRLRGGGNTEEKGNQQQQQQPPQYYNTEVNHYPHPPMHYPHSPMFYPHPPIIASNNPNNNNKRNYQQMVNDIQLSFTNHNHINYEQPASPQIRPSQQNMCNRQLESIQQYQHQLPCETPSSVQEMGLDLARLISISHVPLANEKKKKKKKRGRPPAVRPPAVRAKLPLADEPTGYDNAITSLSSIWECNKMEQITSTDGKKKMIDHIN